MSEIQRVYVKAWHEPEAEYVRVPPGDLVPVVFDEPSDDVLLPRLAWMRREDVITEAEIRQATADEVLREAGRRIIAEADAEEYGHLPKDLHPYLRAALLVRELREEIARRVGGGGGGGQ
jgi:hypothetical protein